MARVCNRHNLVRRGRCLGKLGLIMVTTSDQQVGWQKMKGRKGINLLATLPHWGSQVYVLEARA